MPVKNGPDIFGKQQIMNENDEIIGEEPLLLIGSTDISFDDVAALTKSHDGVVDSGQRLIEQQQSYFQSGLCTAGQQLYML